MAYLFVSNKEHCIHLVLCIDIINVLVQPVSNVFDRIIRSLHANFSKTLRQTAADVLLQILSIHLLATLNKHTHCNTLRTILLVIRKRHY